MSKKIIIYTLLFFILLGSGRVVFAQAGTEAEAGSQITNISNIIKEKTPEFISKPIIWLANKIETFRQGYSETLKTKKESLKKEITAVNETNQKPSITETKSRIEKPIRYILLFLVSLLLDIFSSQLLFYVCLTILVFLMLRFVWLRIF